MQERYLRLKKKIWAPILEEFRLSFNQNLNPLLNKSDITIKDFEQASKKLLELKKFYIGAPIVETIDNAARVLYS